MEVLLRYYQKMSFMSVLVFGTNNNFFLWILIQSLP